MTALMQIDQVGLSGGTPGKTRSDGLLTGATVTVTITVPGETNDLELLWIPDGDTATAASFMATGATTWEFTPSPSCPGTYRILAIVDGVEVEVRELRVRTALLRQIVPSLNELADPTANLLNNGAALVLASEDNENELSLLPGLSGAEPSAVPSPFIGGNYGGWYRWVRDTSIQMEDRAAALDPLGFQRPDSLQDTAVVDSVTSWTAGTGVFTVDPQTPATFYDIFIQGRRVRKESQQTTTLTVEGDNWIYFDPATDLLAHTANPTLEQRADIMRSKTPVAIVLVEDTGEGFNDPALIVDKRHGLGMSPAAKSALQVGVGGRWADGLLPSGFTLGDGSLDTHAQFQISDGFAFMGDLLFSVANATPSVDPQALQPILSVARWLHREDGAGVGVWGRQGSSSAFPTNSGTSPNFDNGFSAATIPDGQYALATYFAVKAMPSAPGVASDREGDRLVAVMGQELFTTEGEAQAGAETVLLDMDTVGLPIQDMIPLFTVIIQKDTGFANAANARVIVTEGGTAFVDHRTVAHTLASATGAGGSTGLNANYAVGPTITLAGNVPVGIDVPVGHTGTGAFEIDLDAAFVPATDGDGAVLFRDNGAARMYLGESPTFGFGLFSLGFTPDMVIATATNGDLAVISQGTGTMTVAAGGTGDAGFGSEGGDALLGATVGSTSVAANIDLTLEATTGAFNLDVGGVSGVLDVTALGVTTLQGGAGFGSLEINASGVITLAGSFGADMNLTTVAGDVIVGAGDALSFTANNGGAVINALGGALEFQLFGTNLISVTALGAITLLGSSNQNVLVETTGTADGRFRHSGSGLLSIEQTGTGGMEINTGTGPITVAAESTLDMSSDSADVDIAAGTTVTITAATGMTQTVTTGAFALDVQGNSLLAQTAGGQVSLQSHNNDALSLVANGTGALILNGGLGLVSVIGAAITLSTGAGSDLNLTAGGTGNILLNAVGDDITLTSLNLGFYGTTAAPQPTITGSRAGNAALASLLTELATLGLIIDGSSA